MKDYVILVDSSCDLTQDLRERFGITDYLPGFIVFPDGHSELSDLDWKSQSPYDYYTSMSHNSFYKTGQRSLASVSSFFEQYLQKGLDILSISLSSALSGTYGSCCVAAKELRDKYPEREIICVDSLRYSGGYGVLCAYAGEMRLAGKSLQETAEWLTKNANRVHQMGTVDDLIFLRKMGRVSNMAAIMGTLVGVKPLADINRGGMSQVIGKTTGYRNAYAAIIDYIRLTITDPKDQIIFISYTNRKAQALQLKERIEKEFSPRETILTVVSKSCGASIGPGMVVAFYLGSAISEDLSHETALMDSVLKG